MNAPRERNKHGLGSTRARSRASEPRRRTWLLAALAPLLVTVGLAGLQSVAFVCASYHLGLCLLIPWLLARREGLSWHEHAARLGLAALFDSDSPATGRSRGLRLGLGAALGVLSALSVPLAFFLAPDLFPTGTQLREVLRSWGADPARCAPLFAFLLLFNGPAEELFWRGYLQDRLLRGPGSAVGLVLLFASYHALTVGRLAGGPGAAALMLAGIVLAGAFWTWSRARWRSIWPALLSHTGAVAGYLAVSWRLLR